MICTSVNVLFNHILYMTTKVRVTHTAKHGWQLAFNNYITGTFLTRMPRKHHGNVCPNGPVHCVKHWLEITLVIRHWPYIAALLRPRLVPFRFYHSNTFQHTAVNFSRFSPKCEKIDCLFIIGDKHPHDHENTN